MCCAVGRKNSSGGILAAATSCRLVTQRLLRRRQGYRRYVSISPLKQSHELAEVDVAVSKEHAVLGSVVASREAQRVSRSVTAQLLRRAQYVMSERMSAENSVLEEVVHEFGGRVVVALYLVYDHLYLLVYLRLRIGAVKDDVGEQVYGAVDVLLQYGGVIHRLLLVGEGVEVAAHALQMAQYLHRAAALRALESDMLAEVRHSLLASEFLVACAGAYSVAAIYHGLGGRKVDYAQSVSKSMRIIVHIH